MQQINKMESGTKQNFKTQNLYCGGKRSNKANNNVGILFSIDL